MITPPHLLERDYREMARMRAAGAGWCDILRAFPDRRRHLRAMRRAEDSKRPGLYRIPDNLQLDHRTLTIKRKCKSSQSIS